jgi:hypothetical protein
LPRADVTSPAQESEVIHSFVEAGQSIFPISSLRPGTGLSRDESPVEEEGDETADGNASLDQAQYTANPLPFISGGNRPFSLRSLLKPSSSRRHTQRVRHVEIDVIGRGLLSHSMATRLFGL